MELCNVYFTRAELYALNNSLQVDLEILRQANEPQAKMMKLLESVAARVAEVCKAENIDGKDVFK